MMELQILSKETIKPVSSTPPELRNLPFSWFDQHTPNVYTHLLYFYNITGSSSGHGRSQLLKDSLSKALTFYYPFAGRLGHEGNSIDCNDMGATFLEAKLRRSCPMSDIVNMFDSQRDEILKLLCFEEMKGEDSPLLYVQLTQFECGGEVICVVLAHKIGDAATLINFMNDWASIARSSGGVVPPTVCPRFDSASLFRPEMHSSGREGSGSKGEEKNVSSRRLVFDGSKIVALNGMVCEKVKNPSRVQLLTAFIYKAALSAKSSVSGGLSNQPTTSLLQLINLRSRLEPPLPVTLAGNIISFFIASSTTPEQRAGMELWRFVGEVKRNFVEFCRKLPRYYKEKEWSLEYKLFCKESMERWINNPGDHIMYTCTSWCRFPIYEADFGWGKPIWITVPTTFLAKNMIILMDAKDGEGIQAIVTLDKEEMIAFEQNQELLSFCELKC